MAEEHEQVTEPEQIIAFPATLPLYKVTRAKHLAGFVREILERARMEMQAGQTAWVKLEMPEDDVYVKACWELDLMATVWVRERGDVFYKSMAPQVVVWQELELLQGTVAEVARAVGNLGAHLRESVSRDKLGRGANGLQFEGFFAPKSVIDVLDFPMRQIGKIRVIPEAEAEATAMFGKDTFPLNVGNGEAFLVQVCSAVNWKAKGEAMRVAEVFIQVGAAGIKREVWCLLCAN